jgi:hypothetical protein
VVWRSGSLRHWLAALNVKETFCSHEEETINVFGCLRHLAPHMDTFAKRMFGILRLCAILFSMRRQLAPCCHVLQKFGASCANILFSAQRPLMTHPSQCRHNLSLHPHLGGHFGALSTAAQPSPSPLRIRKATEGCNHLPVTYHRLCTASSTQATFSGSAIASHTPKHSGATS